MTKREAVARALCAMQNANPDEPYRGGDDPAWMDYLPDADAAILTADAWDAAEEADADDLAEIIEVVAERIYGTFEYGGLTGTKPPWERHGNSEVQVKARAMAAKELAEEQERFKR